MITFPWGKFAYEPLDEVPTSYLTYALEKFDNMSADLTSAIKEELKSRFRLLDDETDEGTITVPLKKVYREMARKYHPDKGGTNEQFQAINDFYNRLINE